MTLQELADRMPRHQVDVRRYRLGVWVIWLTPASDREERAEFTGHGETLDDALGNLVARVVETATTAAAGLRDQLAEQEKRIALGARAV